MCNLTGKRGLLLHQYPLGSAGESWINDHKFTMTLGEWKCIKKKTFTIFYIPRGTKIEY